MTRQPQVIDLRHRTLFPDERPSLLLYAYATLKDRQWVIPHYPFCSKRHWHGAGGGTEDPRRFLGSRVPHCVDRRDRRGRVIWAKRYGDDYWLTDDPTLDGQAVPESLYAEIGGVA